MTQEYICGACCYAGAVVIRDHADVYQVLEALASDHKAHSPDCPQNNFSGMRVRDPERCTPEQWEQVKAGVREERELSQERDV